MAKYVYSFSWMGRPVIQLPAIAIRIQELIYELQPDVIVETGWLMEDRLLLKICAGTARGV